MTRIELGVLTVALAGLCASACAVRPGGRDVAARSDAVVVGAFNFSESRILAEIYATTLRRSGIDAEVLDEVASREIMEPALEQRQVDMVPEYLGTALAFLEGDAVSGDVTAAQAHRALTSTFEERGVRVMTRAPGQNRNEIVVTATLAAEHSLDEIGDLARVDQDLVFGGPPECPSRPLCLAGLEDVYGLSFREFRPLDSGGPATIAALTGGEVDVALLFTTNPLIVERGLIVLDDDRNLQPPENVVPVLRADVAQTLGAPALDAIDRVTRRLSNDALRTLNALVELDGETPEDAARSWLESEGLLEEAA